MSEQEMFRKIKELEQENYLLKNRTNAKMRAGIIMNMGNLNKLSFLYPRFDGMFGGEIVKGWRTKVLCSSSDHTNLRNVASSVIDMLNVDNDPFTLLRKNTFTKQNLNNLSADDTSIVVSCCEEIVDVLTKYKIQYLQKQGCSEFLKVFQDAGVIELE